MGQKYQFFYYAIKCIYNYIKVIKIVILATPLWFYNENMQISWCGIKNKQYNNNIFDNYSKTHSVYTKVKSKSLYYTIIYCTLLFLI